MRIGVSAKIFLAYAVLLSVFGANSLFTLLYLHRGRQELAANQRRLEVQVAVDAALRSLEDFSSSRANDSSGIPQGLTSRVAAQNGIASARQNLRDALAAVDQYLNDEANPRCGPSSRPQPRESSLHLPSAQEQSARPWQPDCRGTFQQ